MSWRSSLDDKSNCYPPVTTIGGSKRKTPEQLADPVGLFGRSRTLFKFLRACQQFIC
jgi:hypothetical protein